MEQDILQQILSKLDKLDKLEHGLDKLEQGQHKLEQGQHRLELDMQEMKEELKGDIERIRHAVAVIEGEQHEIKLMLKDDKVYHQELIERHGPRINALEESMGKVVMDIDFLKKSRKANAVK